MQKIAAYNHAMVIMSYDSETVMPKAGAPGRGMAMGILSGEMYSLITGEEMQGIMAEMAANIEKLDAATKREIELGLEEIEEISKIPKEEYIAFQVLVNDATMVWREAKNTNDYAKFEPYLKQIIDFVIKFANYMKPGVHPLDTWLDKHEKGMTMEVLDRYFADVKAKLVPLIHAIAERGRKIETDFLKQEFPIDAQRKLSEYLMEVLTIDRNRCAIGEVEHPFMSGLSSQDVRMTTHYYADNLLSSLFSVVHEGGHATYELGVDPTYDFTPLSGGVSTGIHESQSRFFENIIGRSEEFINLIYPKLAELFPEQLKDVSAHELYLAANESKPSLIRIEADELTYSLHIMVRYEAEKRIMSGTITTAELPALWNALYKEYLGVDVPDDAHGVLQDVHWSGGMFGYFPSYSVGSAYASQLYAAMMRDLDVPALVKAGDIRPIVNWLGERIHRFGMFKKPSELLEQACGAPFDPTYYTDYLIRKYSEVFGL